MEQLEKHPQGGPPWVLHIVCWKGTSTAEHVIPAAHRYYSNRQASLRSLRIALVALRR